MKRYLIFLFVLFFQVSCASSAQVDQEVLNVLKTRIYNTGVHELIFMENELIVLCQDSIGQDMIKKRFDGLKKVIPKMQDSKRDTELLALSILKERITLIKTSNEKENESQIFLENQLKNFEFNFTIDETFVSKLFDENKRDLSTKEPCDVGVSMYVIFIKDPMLYIKVLKENKKINPDGKIYFPLNCTLKEYDKPEAIRMKMKLGLMESLDSRKKEKDFDKIYSLISKAKVDGSYD